MRQWVLFILTAMAMQAQADDVTYKYLVFTTDSGTKTFVASEGLKLTVSNGSLVATAADGTTTTMPLATLTSMAFAESASGATGLAETPLGTGQQSVEVFTLAGIRLGTFSSTTQLRQALGAGIYLVKQNGTTKKITVK